MGLHDYQIRFCLSTHFHTGTWNGVTHTRKLETNFPMRRFFVENPIIDENGACVISGSEARHMTKVIRMARGDRFVLMGGNGEHFLAVVRSIGPREVRADIERALGIPAPSPVEITLCQALLRSDPMDYLIQKTSELGVDRIFPFFSSRTVAKIGAEKFEKKAKHWQGVATSAAKQCGRPLPARISTPISLPELLAGFSGEDCPKLVLWEEEESTGLKKLLQESYKRERIIGMVGPEGGFSEDEIEMTREEGFIPVSLGSRVLRAETAAMAMVAVVQYEWGDLGIK